MARLKTISTKVPERKVFSVSELNFRAKQILESELRQIWLEAEMSNVTIASSGHWYFTLKDTKSQVSCAMFRGSNRMTTVQPREGMKVLVRGRVSLYEPRGNYQLIVDQMSSAGEGDLLAKYEALKNKLAEEGLFAESIKQSIQPIYETIGIISSPSGAAVHDVLSTIKRRFPLQQVILYPSLVQGEQAVESIRRQLAIAVRRDEVDVLLLVRGGGAIEDLWCFNDEQLARDIVACPIPIVSGIGHEVDFTIADFVSDLRAATPTAAAEKTTPDQYQLMQELNGYKAWFESTMKDQLQRYSQTLDWLTRQIKKPNEIIGDQSLNSNARFKMGKSINYNLKTNAVFETPSSIEIPVKSKNDKILFAAPQTYYHYENRKSDYKNRIQNTFQHGGISVEELIVIRSLFKAKKN